MAAGAVAADTTGAAEGSWRERVAPVLLQLHDTAATRQAQNPPTAPPPTAASPAAPRLDAAGRVQVDVHYDCALPAPTAALAQAGLAAQAAVKVAPLCVVEGWVLPAALPQVATVEGVTRIRVPAYVVHARPGMHGQIRATANGGAIDGNGIAITRAQQFVAQTGTSGAGVTVGVQSAGVQSLSIIVSRGELPGSVQVLVPASGSVSEGDEGTMLLEELHAAAPGAGLAFCGPDTFVDYISCMQKLIAAGATVLADDTSFVADDVMAVDDNAQAIAGILSQHPGVTAFTAAGNAGGSYWEGSYAPVAAAGSGVPGLSCTSGSTTQTDTQVATFGTDAGGNPIYGLTLTVSSPGDEFPFLFAWADPPDAAPTSRFDLYIFTTPGSGSSGSATTPTQVACLAGAQATSNEISDTLDLAGGTYTLYVATPDTGTAGKYLKIWAGGDGLTTLAPATAGGFVTPQSFATGMSTVGAVNGSDGIGDDIESFSSQGPITLQFPTPSQLQAPTVVAPDGIAVDAQGTEFESELFPDGNFYGTSAAVANGAAVAVLLWADFPGLSPAQLLTAVQSGAAPLGTGTPNTVFGYGRTDALGALATLPGPTITALTDAAVTGSAATPAIPFTVTGTGSLHFQVASSNTALVPARLGASPGVSLSPSGCGVSTLSCTLSVTPALGQSGQATITLSALDGANRAASAGMTLTSTDPAPVPAAPASHGGGALDGLTLAVLAGFATLAALRPRGGAPSRPAGSQTLVLRARSHRRRSRSSA
ncbi:MAG TPA: S8 family serine peptidase [Steroidobacteraceae bacterium]|nr:S8 family serine peptidase [Steroidobacteraceae bacterium]